MNVAWNTNSQVHRVSHWLTPLSILMPGYKVKDSIPI